jgi:uncharacterized damage-inducible protein DinB
MLGARFNWFHLWMGEGDPNLDWNDDEDNDEPTVYKAASLVAMFEKSWRVISSALDRWTSADLEQLFFYDGNLSRSKRCLNLRSLD